MTYVKVDDHFPEHPKVLDIGPLAESLWLRGLCYAGRNQTDGFIPAAFIRRMHDMDAHEEAERLVLAGLWHADGGVGYRIHGYTDWQTSKDRIQDISSKRAAAGSKGGKQKASNLLASKPSKVYPETETETETEVETEKKQTPPNPLKGESLVSRKPPTYSDAFEVFWSRYPKGHGNKKQAGAQWDRLSPDAETQAAIFAGLDRWMFSDRWRNGYVKDAQIWLRDRWWENDPPVNGATNGRVSHQSKAEDIRDKLNGAARLLGWDSDDGTIDVSGVER